MLLDAELPWDWSTYYETLRPAYIQIARPAQVQLCLHNDRRAALLISTSNTDVFVSPDPTLVNAGNSLPVQNGIHLPVTQGPLMITAQDWGPMVTSEWWGATNGLGSGVTVTTFTVIEVVYSGIKPPPKRGQYESFTSLIRSGSKPNGITSAARSKSPSLWDMVFSACRSQGNNFGRPASNARSGNRVTARASPYLAVPGNAR